MTTNGFVLNHDKSLQIYLFCVKRQTKNDFLKDIKGTVGMCTGSAYNIYPEYSDSLLYLF